MLISYTKNRKTQKAKKNFFSVDYCPPLLHIQSDWLFICILAATENVIKWWNVCVPHAGKISVWSSGAFNRQKGRARKRWLNVTDKRRALIREYFGSVYFNC